MSAERPYLNRRWQGLHWSAWMPLSAAHPLALAQLPEAPGFVRIRQADHPGEILWIVHAPEGVRIHVERLARQVSMSVAPYDESRPHVLDLWERRRHTGAGFLVSGAAFHGTTSEAQVQLDMLRQAHAEEATALSVHE